MSFSDAYRGWFRVLLKTATALDALTPAPDDPLSYNHNPAFGAEFIIVCTYDYASGTFGPTENEFF